MNAFTRIALATIALAACPHADAQFADVSSEFQSVATIGIAKVAPTGASNPGVLFAWRMYAPNDVDILTVSEFIPTSFDVVSVCDAGFDRLAVAGVSRKTGNSVIEIWQVRGPEITLAYPSGELRLNPRGLERVARIQDAGSDVFPRPVWINCIYGIENKLYAQYRGGSLYELPIGPGSPRLIADGDQTAGVDQVTLNAHNYPLYTARHQTHGRFLLVNSHSASMPHVLLRDSDLDGEVDIVVDITEATREQMALDDKALWESE